MSLDGYLRVDDVSAKTLGLFARDPHPSAFVDSKRDAGILALFDTCVTPRGRRLLRERFTRPILCVETIESRLDAVEFFARDGDAAAALDEALARARLQDGRRRRARGDGAERDEGDAERGRLGQAGRVPARKRRARRDGDREAERNDVRREGRKGCFFLREARGGGGGGGGDSSFSDDDATFTGEAACAASVRWVPGTPEAVRRLPTAARGAKQLLSIVASTIDLGGVSSGFSDGGWSYRPVVRAEVSEALDDARRVLRGLPDLLARAAREECERVPRFLRHGRGFTPDRVAIQYLPTLGFAAKLRGARLTADLAEELADWEFAFEAPDEDALESLVHEDADAVFGDPNAPNDFETTRGTTSAPAFYYFTDLTRELDALVGDALMTAEDLEAEVLRDLRARTLRGARGLRQLALCVGEIDVALALARAAVAHRLAARPRVVRENALRIRGGGTSSSSARPARRPSPTTPTWASPEGFPTVRRRPMTTTTTRLRPNPPTALTALASSSSRVRRNRENRVTRTRWRRSRFSRTRVRSSPPSVGDGGFGRPRLRARGERGPARDARSTGPRSRATSTASRARSERRPRGRSSSWTSSGRAPRSADGAGLLCGFVRALAEAAEGGPRAFVTTHFAEVAGRDPRAPPAEPGDRAHARGGGRARDGGVRGARRGDY